MTARSIPQQPLFRCDAERRVWSVLREALPDDVVLIPGLRFSDRRQDREADLLIAWPDVGIAVIEVKGGQLSLSERRWQQTSANGHTTTVHPVTQARQCKYLLRDYLDQHPRWRRGRVRMVHMVAFPATIVPQDFAAPDCERWRIIDKADLGDSARLVRDALAGLVGAPDPPDADAVEALVDCLAGTLLPQRDLLHPLAADVQGTVAERAQTCDVLTSHQARVLDLVRLNRRVEILGGAGSGKTWLAVEQARRLAADGRRVGLVCYSRGLAAFLRRRVELLRPEERPAYVGTFHGLGVEWLGAPSGSDDDSDFWERRLPERMADLAVRRPAQDRFDAFVVDEAQDFADTWWPAVLAALRDDARGGLYVFADERQRVFARQGRPPVQLASIVLDENLRNTRQIARTFGSLAPTQMRYRGGDGVPVRFVPCATSEAVTTADDEAVALLEGGWTGEHLALLTTGPRHPLQVERQARGAAEYWRSYWDGDDLFYGHVLGFKGLERPAVVLALNGFRDLERAPEMLYVGLSRARDLLVVCGDPRQVRAVGGVGVARRLGILT